MSNENEKPSFNLPFTGEWLTFWGGDELEQNRHKSVLSQQHAFDFIKVDESGAFYRSNGKTNEDYYSFGEDVFAAADGVVIEAVDGMQDNMPGTLNTFNVMGNYVMIKHTEDLFSVTAHLKQNSVVVSCGDKVTVGQKIGECGNSGNTTDPHIHFHVQDSPVFTKFDENYNRVDVAKGVKVFFKEVKLKEDGKVSTLSHYTPVKNDLIL